jgi:hypothetical protein
MDFESIASANSAKGPETQFLLIFRCIRLIFK